MEMKGSTLLQVVTILTSGRIIKFLTNYLNLFNKRIEHTGENNHVDDDTKIR